MMRSLSLPARRLPAQIDGPKALLLRLLLAAGRRDFGCEIGFLLVDSLAQSIAHKSGHLDRCADLALSFFYRLGDRLAILLGVDRGLLQQTDFLVEGLQTRIADLLDDVLR